MSILRRLLFGQRHIIFLDFFTSFSLVVRNFPPTHFLSSKQTHRWHDCEACADFHADWAIYIAVA